MISFYGSRRSFSHSRQNHGLGSRILKLLRFFTALFILYQFITVFLLSSFTINSAAMEPAIERGQKILSSPLLTGVQLFNSKLIIPPLRSFSRGDIVIIKPVNSEDYPWYFLTADAIVRFFTFQHKTLFSLTKSTWNNNLTVKRIIGLPGDTIKLVDFEAFIKVQGKGDFLNELILSRTSYTVQKSFLPAEWDEGKPFDGNMEEIALKDGEYFVLNDNRSVNNDSRLFGPVLLSNIKSLVILKYLPGFSAP